MRFLLFRTGRFSFGRTAFLFLCAALFFVSFAWADGTSSPSFFASETVLRVGQSQIIPFHLEPAPTVRTVFELQIDPGDAFQILQQPTILPNHTLGYLRIRPLRGGSATLKIKGTSAALALKMVADEVPAPRPEITTPVAGSNVWGKIAVGVELFSEDPMTDDRPVFLKLPDGSEIAPSATPGPREGCHRRFVFQVDADRVPRGIHFLSAVVREKGKSPLWSDPLALNIIRPAAAELLSGTCVDQLKGPRSTKAGEKLPQILKDPKAPGGSCVANYGPNPGWCLGVNVPTAGYYQLMMTVRGDFGGGALPTIGVRLNEDNIPLASARLADTAWHRLPIGAPFRLPAGAQVITAAYLNDFFGNKTDDRNLFLGSYELVRVEGGNRSEGGESMMMGMNETMAEAPGSAMVTPEPAMDKNGSDDVDMSEITGPGVPLRVAFDRVIEGEVIDGVVTLHGRSWRQHAALGPEARTELLINGVVRGTEEGPDLLFKIDPSAFAPGPNTIALHVTLPNGLSADAPAQRIFLDADAPASFSPLRFYRFTTVDTAWERSLLPHLQQPDKNRPDKLAFLSSATPITLTLSENMEGNFRVILEANAQDGTPLVRGELHTNDPGSPTLQATVTNKGMGDVSLGTVRLGQGEKQISLTMTPVPIPVPPTPPASSGPVTTPPAPPAPPASLWLRSLRLEEVASNRASAPTIHLLYPFADAVLGPVDAVVARPFSAAGVAWADVVLDGQPLGLRLRPQNGLGQILFPLTTRNISPGIHRLKVIVQSNDNQSASSPEISVQVPSTSLGEKSLYARAIHLLDRFAYGPDPDELAAILIQGEQVWLRERLSERGDSPALADLDQETGVAYPDDRGSNAPVRAIHQLLLTTNPVRARFVMWTENHFSTWVDKVQNGPKWREHRQFWSLGVAPFPDLLFASATSPAMLVYLDQFHSFADKLNENYAREIMELHTLGVHGGYTQTDVTTLAGLLNGWTLSDEADLGGAPGPDPYRVFRFDPSLNDGKSREILGLEFPEAPGADRFDRVLLALEMLASHPSTAEFVCRKLAEEYVGDPAPQALVDRLKGIYLSTGGDMRALLIAISTSPEFWASEKTPRLATPLDYSLRLARIGGFIRPERIVDFLKQSGAGLFERATPDGYPENDSEYASSNALLQRWRLAQEMQQQLANLVPTDWLRRDANAPQIPSGELIDFLAIRLTGELLSKPSQEAAEEVLGKITATGPDRVMELASFICQLPEANLR